MAPYGAHADLWGLAAACPHPSAPAQEGRSAAFYQAAHLAGAGGPSASGGAFAAKAAAAVKARYVTDFQLTLAVMEMHVALGRLKYYTIGCGYLHLIIQSRHAMSHWSREAARGADAAAGAASGASLTGYGAAIGVSESGAASGASQTGAVPAQHVDNSWRTERAQSRRVAAGNWELVTELPPEAADYEPSSRIQSGVNAVCKLWMSDKEHTQS